MQGIEWLWDNIFSSSLTNYLANVANCEVIFNVKLFFNVVCTKDFNIPSNFFNLTFLLSKVICSAVKLSFSIVIFTHTMVHRRTYYISPTENKFFLRINLISYVDGPRNSSRPCSSAHEREELIWKWLLLLLSPCCCMPLKAMSLYFIDTTIEVIIRRRGESKLFVE